MPLSTHCTKPQAQAAQAAAIGASERLAKSSAPLGNPSVTPVSWDTYAAPAPTAPTPLLVQDQKTLHNMPMWPPGHIQSTLLPSRYPMQHPQQVLVLSNFLQEASRMCYSGAKNPGCIERMQSSPARGASKNGRAVLISEVRVHGYWFFLGRAGQVANLLCDVQVRCAHRFTAV